MTSTYYILDPSGNITTTDSRDTWIQSMNTHYQIGIDNINNIGISTKFIGYNNTMFETALIPENGPVEIIAIYKTYDEALNGHQDICTEIKNGKTFHEFFQT
jgi:hypothetical protein